MGGETTNQRGKQKEEEKKEKEEKDTRKTFSCLSVAHATTEILTVREELLRTTRREIERKKRKREEGERKREKERSLARRAVIFTERFRSQRA